MIKDAARKHFETAAAGVEEIDADSVDPASLDDWVVIDVREDAEYKAGHLPGAISLPRSRLELQATQINALEAATDKPALVYCASGKRSILAADTLKTLGATRPVSMSGGFQAWRAAGKPENGG